MTPGELQMTPEQEAAYFQECIDAENKVFLLAVVDDTVVGACGFEGGRRQRTQHAGEFGMSVRKSDWGQGIGRLLVETLLSWARSTTVVRKVNLRVRTDNPRAIALYERCGFVLEGTQRQEMHVGDEFHDLHCMGLILPHDAPAGRIGPIRGVMLSWRVSSTDSAAARRLQLLGIIRCVQKGRATRYPNRWSINDPAKWKCASLMALSLRGGSTPRFFP
jgi:RimJ/RimL family protein N-acetyltransferase